MSSVLIRKNSLLCPYSIFYFFYWRYNPMWVLAFSVIFFHSTLSLHNFLHPLIPIISISSSMSSIHLFLGLPLFLLPVGFHSSTLLGIFFPPSVQYINRTIFRPSITQFTFMLPCIILYFFLNIQQDALIIHIYSVIKLYMLRASSLPIIRSFLLYIRHS